MFLVLCIPRVFLKKKWFLSSQQSLKILGWGPTWMTGGGPYAHIWSKRRSGSGKKVCLNLLLLLKWRQRVALRSPDVHSLALIRSWPTVKWTERGPLGKSPASTLHVSNFGGVSVCLWGRNYVCVQVCQHDTQPTCPPDLKSSAQPGFVNTVNLKPRRISISSFWPLFGEIICLVMQPRAGI